VALALYRPRAEAPKWFVNEAGFGMLVAASPVLSDRCPSLYPRRWGAEDGIRFLKSEISLKRVRAMSWRALEHMLNAAALTMTVIALIACGLVE